MPRYLEDVSRRFQRKYYKVLIKKKMVAKAPSPLLCLCADGFCDEDSPFHDYELDSVLGHDPVYNILDFTHLDARPRTGFVEAFNALEIKQYHFKNWIIDPARSDQIDSRVRQELELGYNVAMDHDLYRKDEHQAYEMFRCIWHHYILTLEDRYRMPTEDSIREHWERTSYHIRRMMFSAARGLVREAVANFAIDFAKLSIPSVIISCYGSLEVFDQHVRDYLLTQVSCEGFYWGDQDEMTRPESHFKEPCVVWDDSPDDLKCIDQWFSTSGACAPPLWSAPWDGGAGAPP